MGEEYLLPVVREGAGWARPSTDSLFTLAHHGPPLCLSFLICELENRGTHLTL